MAIAGVLLLGIGVFHGRLLKGIAEFLIVDTHGADATAVMILEEGDRRFDVAEQLYKGGVTKILLVRRRPNRLERLGVLPMPDELARRELGRRRIPADSLVLLPEGAEARSRLVASLGDWLKQHPHETLALLCDRFTSRTWKVLLARATEAGVRKRIQIVPLSHRRYDETTWWRSKQGTRALFNGYVLLGFHLLNSGDEPEGTERTDADFQSAFAGGSSE